jgi:hypothetical protein
MSPTTPTLTLRLALVLAGALTLAACDRSNDARLLMVVTASGTPANVTALNVTLNGPGGIDSARYTRAGAEPILFPTTLVATIRPDGAGAVTIDIVANDAGGGTVASGHAGPITIRAGERQTAYVQLECAGGPCVVTGPGGPDGGVPDASPRCGNGQVDPGETCDTAIAPGDPGACPLNCDDHVTCTRDMQTGSACTVACTHVEIVDTAPGDRCCPAHARSDRDPDCSPTCDNGTVEPGETCDIRIAQGSPGACANEITCSNADACARELLVSADTCSAVCVRYPITVQAQPSTVTDGCCPAGANNASDGDCPVACGNGLPEVGESCDVGIPAPAPGSCPASCDDGMTNTKDFVAGAACQAACVHAPITEWVSGDGFCPTGATSATDADCPIVCGNGLIERGEACDKAGSGPIACPTSCPPSPTRVTKNGVMHDGCINIRLIGDAADCSARCLVTEVATCSAQTDACCPAGCTWANDPDCSVACGDGFLQPSLGEECEVLSPPGQPDACPSSCPAPNRCTEARLVSAGTCAAICVALPITSFRAGDGCCAPGGNSIVDPDCDVQCGNGIVERPAERCDHAVGGSCPDADACPPADACTTVFHRGTTRNCSAECISVPKTACSSGDGCCPPGCSAAADSDCPVICGNGIRDAGERCDRGITAGAPDSCPRSCDDGDACTVDVVSGSVEGCTRTCTHRDITACLAGDGCCPTGCTPATDRDCAPECGDGQVGAGETCDPPATCPTTCPDDGDPCTVEQLAGGPTSCNAACRHIPITACSGQATDRCCPTGCGAATDTDC